MPSHRLYYRKIDIPHVHLSPPMTTPRNNHNRFTMSTSLECMPQGLLYWPLEKPPRNVPLPPSIKQTNRIEARLAIGKHPDEVGTITCEYSLYIRNTSNFKNVIL
mmetsp:Transcript_28263/g.59469  ORF Transcript_28263/g.59469 Transcript_28263/m.59469 type:complete len:105 (+) Transcript_28263:649-963(+)